MKYVLLVGRILFAVPFLFFGPRHLTRAFALYAASHGVPLASIAAPIAGVLAILGGLSVLLGHKSKIGAWFLVIFLIPVTFFMHNFWAVTGPMLAQDQIADSSKNLAMLGCALLVGHFGSGPLSLDGSGAPK